MRARVLAVALAGSLAVLSSGAPVNAATKGTITGRVVNRDTDEPVRGIRLVLAQSSESQARPEILRTRTDRRGRFEFSDLPTGEFLYSLTTMFDGGYYGGAVQLPANTARRPVVDTTLRVWPSIDDPNVIIIQRDALFLSVGEGGLDVIESVEVVNNSNRAYIGRGGGESEGPRPSLGFAVPSNAQVPDAPLVDSSIDITGPMPSDFGFSIAAAIPPGESRFTFAYRIPGTAGNYTLARSALYPTLNTLVHAEPPLTIDSNRLVRDEGVTIGDTTYALWRSTRTMEAGDTLQVAATAEAEGIGLWLGVGAAALLIIGLLAFTFARRRMASVPQGRPSYGGHPVPETREHLLSLIAALDLRYRGGDITEEEWATRRAELKGRLNEFQEPEPAK